MYRTSLACDRCHALKVKCVSSVQGCQRCKRLQIACVSERVILKPGRKPRVLSPESTPVSNTNIYPVLDCLRPFGVVEDGSLTPTDTPFPYLCSPWQASQLLDNFYSSPNRDIHRLIIRRVTLLGLRTFRQTSPALLLTIICLSCYLPTCDGQPVLPNLNHGSLVRLRNTLLSTALTLLKPVFLAEPESPFDDVVSLLQLCHIATSDDEKHGYLPQWLSQFKFLVKQMNFDIEPEGFDEECKEERRRLWWAAFIADRHSSLSFNMRPVLVDADCQSVLRPCHDSIWESDMPLPSSLDDESRPTGVDYEVYTMDFFGIFVPLFAILGNVLEYHFIRRHKTFGANSAMVQYMRESTQRSLEIWSASIDRNCKDSIAEDACQAQQEDSPFPSESKLLLYGRHIFHSFFILLHGKMDLVEMFNDTNWLLSRDFLTAAEHAEECVKIAAEILSFDPKLQMLYRIFGTYLLQSSFIFLILVRKLKDSADQYILSCCTTNLRALDAFVATVNISYQKTFARMLRETLSRRMNPQQDLITDGSSSEQDDNLSPELLKYRWTPGFNGLWCEDMGRPKEAKMRKFTSIH